MNSLTPDQAQALWSAGGFIVVADLPAGSEYGIDGVFHTTLTFSGTKFLPPGLHLISWSFPPSAPRKPVVDTGSPSSAANTHPTDAQGAGAIPLRQALIIHAAPRARYLLRYYPELETLVLDKDAVLSDDHLKSLDTSMASYPFHSLEGWKSLTSAIDEGTLKRVVGEDGKVDGIRRVDGEVDEVNVPDRPSVDSDTAAVSQDRSKPKHQVEEDPLRFTLFDPKRSWRDGAVGEEITRFSKDKSWLLGDVLRRLEYDPQTLIAELQLAFILVLNLSSFGALQVYKRIVQILCRSIDIHTHPDAYVPQSGRTADGKPRSGSRAVRRLYLSFLRSLAAQITALPEGVFDSELPELDIWLLGEIDVLRSAIRGAFGSLQSVWNGEGEQGKRRRAELQDTWNRLMQSAKRFRWELSPLDLHTADAAEVDAESEEEGEYAPVLVDM